MLYSRSRFGTLRGFGGWASDLGILHLVVLPSHSPHSSMTISSASFSKLLPFPVAPVFLVSNRLETSGIPLAEAGDHEPRRPQDTERS